MNLTILPKSGNRGLFRTFLLATISLFAFAGATTESKAQGGVPDVVETLAPVLEILDAEGLLDLEQVLDDLLGGSLPPADLQDLLDELLLGDLADLAVLEDLLGDLSPGELEGLLGGLIEVVTDLLGGDDILGSILDETLDEDLLEDVVETLNLTLAEVEDLLADGSITDPTILDPLRELLLSVIDILLGLGGEDLLDDLGLTELLPTGDLLNLGILDLDILNDILGDEGLLASIGDLLEGLLGGLLSGNLDVDITDLIEIVISIINENPEIVDPEAPVASNPDLIDLIVGKKPGAGKGNNIYGTTAGQRLKDNIGSKKRAKYAFTVQNDGSRTDRPALKGTRGKKGLKVKYSVGGSNQTAAIIAGRFNGVALAPFGAYAVQVKIKKGTFSKKSAKIRMNAFSQYGAVDSALLKLKNTP